MRLFKILALMMAALAWAPPSMAQNTGDYNPGSPDEPGAPTIKHYYQLSVFASPSEGGSAYGGGSFLPGSTATLRAYANSGYVFEGWADSRGEVVSNNANFTVTTEDCNTSYIALFRYSPSTPNEPQPGNLLVYYPLTIASTQGGTAYGGGRYQAGTNVTLSVSVESGYVFSNWTNQDGEVVSDISRFTYTTQDKAETLTANFRYSPSTPAEPSEPNIKPKHWLYVASNDGGYVNINAVRMQEGAQQQLTATANSGYLFSGWFLDGEIVSTNRTYTFVMGDSDAHMEARFLYSPSAPNEPMSTPVGMTFFLVSPASYPGKAVEFPVLFTNEQTVGDMTFQITFLDELPVDWSTLKIYDRAAGYEVSVNESSEPGVYVFTLTGSTMEAGNSPLFSVMLDVPEDAVTGSDYLIRINQVSVTLADTGETVTARTRNGRVYLYPLGDTNGDNVVDIFDRLNMGAYILSHGDGVETFIPEVSDINEDGEFDVFDCVGIIDIILKRY